MASGFLVLSDGRCLAIRSAAHDEVLLAVAEHIGGSPHADALREYIGSLIPGPDDVDYGIGWYRTSDRQNVMRWVDIRDWTTENQRLFHQAALAAGQQARLDTAATFDDRWEPSLVKLANMVTRADRGEPPLSRSDLRDVSPPKGDRVGPGW